MEKLRHRVINNIPQVTILTAVKSQNSNASGTISSPVTAQDSEPEDGIHNIGEIWSSNSNKKPCHIQSSLDYISFN